MTGDSGAATRANMSTQQKLISEIERFLAKHDMAPTRFGSLVMADPSFVFDLQHGRDIKTSTVEKVRAFMATFPGEARPKRGRPPLVSVA